jgi:streptomycin 3"-adenylyltransferase
MHYAVCRSAGWPVLGRPPRELIGEIPQGIILGYLAGELGWGLDNAPEAYCVLNACRALIFLADRTIVSKIAGGQTALARGLGPPAVIRRALDQQQGKAPDQPPGSDAAEYVRATAARLRSAASQAKNTGT